MNVILLEPAFPAYQRDFARALAEVGATVIGIGERSRHDLDEPLRRWLAHYEQVRSVVDDDALYAAVRRIQDMLWVDRLEATIEAHVLPAARVRERCTIPGTSVRTAWLCRDKPSMKEVLRAAGIPCARTLGTSDVRAALEFAARVGYPLIVKPRAAAGASGTVRVDDRQALLAALGAGGVGHGESVALEEFVEGHEGFLDTLTVAGQVRHEFITHYYPNVLEAMRERWISPQMVATNRIDSSGYREAREVARKVIGALGIHTSATHMEWFFGPKGLTISEIGCRPPGVAHWQVYNDANDMDLYRDWALAVTEERVEQTPSRRYACGLIALRPEHDGRIAGYDGADRIWQEFGEWITGSHFPEPGTPTQPVAAGYMANAWLRVRHPDYDQLRSMLDRIGRTIRVRAH